MDGEAQVKTPEALESESRSIIEIAEGHLVTDDASAQGAADVLQMIRDMTDRIHATFDPIVEAAHKAHKQALAGMKKHLEPLQRVEMIVKGRVGQYHLEQDRIRREAEMKAAAEARRIQEEAALRQAEALAAAGEMEKADRVVEQAAAAPLPAVQIARPAAPTGVSIRKSWGYRIVDVGAIPREYMMPDEVAIGKVVRALGDKTKIAGIEVFEASSVAVRRTA
jgi:hypothetical protein